MCEECKRNKFRSKEIKEVEITPEMICAGADVVSAFFDEAVAYGSETARVVAVSVYEAMVSVDSKKA